MNKNEYNIKLYNSVFNNKYIKSIIFHHLNLFRIYKQNITFYYFDDWENFKYKDYLYSISTRFPFDIELLPKNIKIINYPIENIKSIKFTSKEELSYNGVGKNGDCSRITVPEWIEKCGLVLFKSSSLDSSYFSNVSTKLTSLIISCRGQPLPEIKPNVLPPSLKVLKLEGAYHSPLGKDVIPNNLKKLKAFQIRLITNDSFPQSLTKISLFSSNHLILNHLPVGLVKLKFCGNQTFNIDNNIRFGPNLKKIKIHCNQFINSVFPNTLKSLSIEMDQLTGVIHLPSSLENISVLFNHNSTHNHQVIANQNSSSVQNLKTLITSITSIRDINNESIIPNTVQSLSIHNINPLLVNSLVDVFPQSLTYLEFGSLFNQVINQNILPLNLETLILGDKYTNLISPESMPSSLKLLLIKNPNYNHQINLSSTHPNTIISCKNINLYYQPQQYKESPNQLHVLKLPKGFKEPLSTLSLQDKSNLNYFNIGDYSDEISLSDLPIQNNIKILELINNNNQIINLEYFKNVEIIIINSAFSLKYPKIITKIDDNNNYQYYNLKNIIINSRYNDYLKLIDLNFIHLININKAKPNNDNHTNY